MSDALIQLVEGGLLDCLIADSGTARVIFTESIHLLRINTTFTVYNITMPDKLAVCVNGEQLHLLKLIPILCLVHCHEDRKWFANL